MRGVKMNALLEELEARAREQRPGIPWEICDQAVQQIQAAAQQIKADGEEIKILQAELKDALEEIKEHNNEYHHVTPAEKIEHMKKVLGNENG